jgi:SAM-dependent methyltransferase
MSEPATKNIAPGMGVRKLTLADQLPDCEIHINKPIYEISEICRGKHVVDIGCGYGRNRIIVEAAGGTWVGVEPFEGGAHTVVGDAENLPFESNTFDVAIMDAVLEHIPDVGKAFSEVARVLKPGGIFIGYVAFMECFHEISYSHISFKALEHYSKINGMKLEVISGGKRFGIDYHYNVLFYPLPFRWFRPVLASMIRGIFRAKSFFARLGLKLKRKMSWAEAKKMSQQYYQLECLRQSVGFFYIIRKKNK